MKLIDFRKVKFKKEGHKEFLWLKENGYIKETGEYRYGEAIFEITEKGKNIINQGEKNGK